ncbi:MAG TPA: hypothetical protein VMB21_12120 [Candidatus Limnocylindria bacterium]|jgi:hypothetical protein|nr:hypothetical protein [Candidatus Limnocylindria bacterium]
MTSSSSKLEFMFEGMLVGCFQERTFPATAGRYRYMPYRGPGHYNLGLRFQELGRAQCHYDVEGDRVFFVVLARPEYGVLELADFERKPQADI